MKQSDYNNYKLGALKRKFKIGRINVVPGTFISKINESKIIKQTIPTSKVDKISVLGLI